MPYLLTEGRRHRVSLSKFLNGNTYQLPFNEGQGRTVRTSQRCTLRYTKPSTVMRKRDRFAGGPYDPAGYDQLPPGMRTNKIPLRGVSTAMDGEPPEKLKRRWANIRSDRSKLYSRNRLIEDSDDDTDEGFEQDGEIEATKEDERVAFCSKIVTKIKASANETDEDNHPIRQSSMTQGGYYHGDDFTVEDVLLLHRIALKWERDRWLDISARFHAKTGRSIHPEQIKSVLGN